MVYCPTIYYTDVSVIKRFRWQNNSETIIGYCGKLSSKEESSGGKSNSKALRGDLLPNFDEPANG